VGFDVATIRAWFDEEESTGVRSSEPEIVAHTGTETWRERLWTCPEEMRLGVAELSEAVNRSTDWVYRAASAKVACKRGRSALPCSRLDGQLTFRAADVRAWVRRSELVVNVAAAPVSVSRRRKHA
jgi:hypothetical protein